MKPAESPELGKTTGGTFSLPGQHGSFWLQDKVISVFPPLREPLSKDVIVLGAGIAGLTSAYLLQRAGLSTALIDARTVLSGVTGHTTAKITAAHGLYHHIFTYFDEESARQYAAANQAGFDTIASLVTEHNIDCDYLVRDFYLYGEESASFDRVKAESEAARKAGLEVYFPREMPLPFSPARGALYPNQAQFHPGKYLRRLLEEFLNKGGEIFENTPALKVTEKGEECRVKTPEAETRSKNVVVATHFPFMMNGLYYIWLIPRRGYVLALRHRQPAPEGMFFQNDQPHIAIRSQRDEAGELLLISGGEHQTGHGGDTREYYHKLEEFSRRYFPEDPIAYYWSTQDNYSLDGLPFAGPLTSNFRRTFVATGFGGWGMTNATAAALAIRDLIQGKPHPWPVLSPQRRMPWYGYKKLGQLNVVLVKAFIKDHLKALWTKDPASLSAGEGRVLRQGFHRRAVSRDEDGQLTEVSPVCTHLGCVVRWNPAEQSWDCPCHGSRFSRKGKVIHGPALYDVTLKK
jgi:glycine/D-amino acid oxidase-like deaminating enzyme/nitrite reductase/ring-hydroxylating ferredoxin subunit